MNFTVSQLMKLVDEEAADDFEITETVPSTSQFWMEHLAKLEDSIRAILTDEEWRAVLGAFDASVPLDYSMAEVQFRYGLGVGAALASGKEPDYPAIKQQACASIEQKMMEGLRREVCGDREVETVS